jgi:hypothetical protein
MFATVAVTPTVPNSLSVAFTATPLGAGERLALWMTLPGTTGRDPNFAQARLVGYSDAADASPSVLTTPYEFAAGNAFNCFIARVDANGRTSVVQKDRVEVP